MIELPDVVNAESDPAPVMLVGQTASDWMMFPTPTTRYPIDSVHAGVTSQAMPVSTEPTVANVDVVE